MEFLNVIHNIMLQFDLLDTIQQTASRALKPNGKKMPIKKYVGY